MDIAAFARAMCINWHFLSRARSLGFSIEDCRALLQLYANDTRASADVKQIAQEHLTRIDAKVKELQAMRNTLSHLIEACAGDDRPTLSNPVRSCDAELTDHFCGPRA